MLVMARFVVVAWVAVRLCDLQSELLSPHFLTIESFWSDL
jgi:hypothetical protein